MAQPFTSTWRIQMSYQVATLTHKAFMFVKASTFTPPVAPQLIDRTGGLADWTAVALRMGAASLQVIINTIPSVTYLLQNKQGLLWVPIDAYSPTQGGSASGAVFVASQVTMTLRDLQFNKLKVVMLDTSEVPPTTVKSLPATGDLHNFALPYTDGAVDVNDPFSFMVSRSGHYLHGSAALVAITTTLNTKVRRKRSLT